LDVAYQSYLPSLIAREQLRRMRDIGAHATSLPADAGEEDLATV